MKPKTIKLLVLILILIFLFGGFTVFYINRPKFYDYYVKYGSNGDGTSLQSPANSVNSAIKAVNKYLGKKDTANIWIIEDNNETFDPLDFADNSNKTHKMAVWKNQNEEQIYHKTKIVISTYAPETDEKTETKTSYLAFSENVAKKENLILTGPTEFKNIILVPTSNEGKIQISEHNIMFGEGLTLQSIDKTGEASYEDWNKVNLTQASVLDAQISTQNGDAIKKDFTIVLDNVNFVDAKLQFGSETAETLFEKNLNIKVRNASKLNILKTSNLKVKGGAQFIVNNATAYITKNEIQNSFETVSSISNENWILYVSPEYIDTINFTAKSGKFEIANNYTAKAYTKDRKLVAESKNGILNLSKNTGVYTVAITKDTVKKSKKYNDYINYRGGYNADIPEENYQGALANTYSKLTEQKKLKVVYFGGSVTVGAGSSHGCYSWRGLIGEWLKNNFPEADIINCNKGIGETGTHLGLYRVKKAVIEEKPDLLFIEYSINDLYDSASYTRASIQFETIVRQVRKELPECDIITIMVTEESCAPNAMNENLQIALHSQALAHEDICQIYNIPTIHVGRALVREFFPEDWQSSSDNIWQMYMTDIVHPTDKGYMAYYTVIKEFMSNTLIFGNYGKCGVENQELPFLQNEILLDGNVTFIDPNPNTPNNSITYPEEYKNNFIYYPDEIGIIKTDNPEYIGVIVASVSQEAYLDIKFKGTELVMLASGNHSSNQYQTQIDGGEWITKNYGGKNPIVIATELQSAEHTIRIRPALNDNITISGFYTADSTKATTFKTQ